MYVLYIANLTGVILTEELMICLFLFFRVYARTRAYERGHYICTVHTYLIRRTLLLENNFVQTWTDFASLHEIYGVEGDQS
jgi:hypothetical protein